jgi:tetratricopeptide (TPR) repeat protein
VKKLNRKSFFVVLVLLLLPLVCFAQDGPNAWGGLTDIFDLPVGARAMAMGGANVACVDDPFALYWNPAALENVMHTGIGLYYSNLPGSTNYNFISLSYPSLFLGTISVGYMGIGTGDILMSDEDASQLGPEDYGRSLFMLGYGYRIFDWMSLGTTLKLERAKFPAYPDDFTGETGNLLEAAFGADFGLLFTPNFDNRYLSNLSFGFNLQNAAQRSIRAEEIREDSPRNLRIGIAKKIKFNTSPSFMTIAFDMSRNDKTGSVPTQYHLGFEYVYMESFMARMGYDRRGPSIGGNGPTYGIGVKQFGLSLDYSFWSGGYDELGSSHRVSLVYELGKDKNVRMEEYLAAEAEKIQVQVTSRLRYEQEASIATSRARANQYFTRGDLVRAYTEVNRVLLFDEEGTDSDFDDMRDLLGQVNEALRLQREKELEAKIVRNQAEADARRQQALVEEHITKARVFYQNEDFVQAIEECGRALEINPESESAKELLDIVDRDLRLAIRDLAAQGDRLKQQGRLMEAISSYNQARRLALSNPQWESLLRTKITDMERRLGYEELLQRAASHERSKNWAQAAEVYQKALKSAPSNSFIQQKYQYTHARANMTVIPMTPEVQELYAKGTSAITSGNYNEALGFLEQARKLQPLNSTILGAIDYAIERKSRQANP